MAVTISTFGPQDVSVHTPRWKPILTAWGKLMDQYHAGTDDLAYAYNERASVGMLALAIHKANSNNFVIEEYRCDRRTLHEDEVILSQGKADLWARVSGEDYTLEAKFHWVSCQREQPWFVGVKPVMADAMRQVQEYDECTDWLVGAVFAVPYLSKKNEQAQNRTYRRHDK